MDGKLSGKVLIVDDEPEIREIVSVNVSLLGLEFVEAKDGEEALEILGSQEIDMVISDLMMPKMSGMMLLQAMREEGYGQPFIFLTAYSSKDLTIQALRLGAFDYLEKPMEGEELRQMITEAIKVSQIQKNLQEEGSQRSSKKNSASPEDEIKRQIMKMRSLRYAHDQSSDGPSKQKEADNEKGKIKEMLVAETLPQLIFCEASIRNLADKESQNWEMAYLLRVMQTVKGAANAIGFKEVEAYAMEAEAIYSLLRVKPSLLSEERIEFLARINESLKRYFEGLDVDSSAEEGFKAALEEMKAFNARYSNSPAKAAS